jgi:hypothetical protein
VVGDGLDLLVVLYPIAPAHPTSRNLYCLFGNVFIRPDWRSEMATSSKIVNGYWRNIEKFTYLSAQLLVKSSPSALEQYGYTTRLNGFAILPKFQTIPRAVRQRVP